MGGDASLVHIRASRCPQIVFREPDREKALFWLPGNLRQGACRPVQQLLAEWSILISQASCFENNALAALRFGRCQHRIQPLSGDAQVAFHAKRFKAFIFHDKERENALDLSCDLLLLRHFEDPRLPAAWGIAVGVLHTVQNKPPARTDESSGEKKSHSGIVEVWREIKEAQIEIRPRLLRKSLHEPPMRAEGIGMEMNVLGEAASLECLYDAGELVDLRWRRDNLQLSIANFGSRASEIYNSSCAEHSKMQDGTDALARYQVVEDAGIAEPQEQEGANCFMDGLELHGGRPSPFSPERKRDGLRPHGTLKLDGLIEARLLNEKRYDYIVSLGRHCQTAYQIRRFTGASKAFFFDWVRTPLVGLMRVLKQDFSGAFLLSGLQLGEEATLVLDRETGIGYRHSFEPDAVTGKIEQASLERQYPEQRRKHEFLLRRWRDVVRGENVLFVRHDAMSPAEVDSLYRALVCYAGHPAVGLLVVGPGAGNEQPIFPQACMAAGFPLPSGAADWKGSDAAWTALFNRHIPYRTCRKQRAET